MSFDSLLPQFRLRVLPSLLPTQVELNSDGTNVRWRYVGGDWQDLVPIDDLSASVQIGTVTTLPPGSSATVTNSGDEQNAVLDIGIPEGEPGTDGVDGSGAVDSVNGAIGTVVLDAGDIAVTPTGGISSTDVQAAIAELDTEKAPKDSPTFTGTVVIPDATLTPAKMQDGAARSVLGVTGNAGATRADIQAANDGDVLRRSGTTVGFGTIVTAGIADAAVTLAKMANIATARLLGRTTAGTGVPEALTGTQVTAMLNAVVGDSGSGGTKGLVPAPASGDAAAGKFLKADGTFAVPGGMTLIGTLTTTSGTAPAQTWSATYRFIYLEFEAVIAGGIHQMKLSISTDGGTNYSSAVSITGDPGTSGAHFSGVAIVEGAGLSTKLGKFVRPMTNEDANGTNFTTIAQFDPGGSLAAGHVNGVKLTGGTFSAGTVRIYGAQ